MADAPRPAPSRADHSYTHGERAALIAPLFGVNADGLLYVILVQTPDGHCDGTTNFPTAAAAREFMQEAMDTMPRGGSHG